jgi:hypothetical protein
VQSLQKRSVIRPTQGDSVSFLRLAAGTMIVPALTLSTGRARGTSPAPADHPPAARSRCAPDTLAVLHGLRYNLSRYNLNRPSDSTRWSVFKAGYLPVRDTNAIRLVTKESVCVHAAAVYTAATGDSARSAQRRVTVVQAGDRFVITDPFTPRMAGEWAIELIADRNWKVLVHLGQ